MLNDELVFHSIYHHNTNCRFEAWQLNLSNIEIIELSIYLLRIYLYIFICVLYVLDNKLIDWYLVNFRIIQYFEDYLIFKFEHFVTFITFQHLLLSNIY